MAGNAAITQLCLDAAEDNRGAVDALMPHVYDALRRMAAQRLRSERVNHTLTPTSLVHEAYLKLVDQDQVGWRNRAHFYAVAAQAMRRILISHARARLAQKRGGGQALVTFDEEVVQGAAGPADIIGLGEALERLQVLSARQSRVVEMRFFGGMNHESIATVLNVSVPTVRRDWRLARAWLSRELKSQ